MFITRKFAIIRYSRRVGFKQLNLRNNTISVAVRKILLALRLVSVLLSTYREQYWIHNDNESVV